MKPRILQIVCRHYCGKEPSSTFNFSFMFFSGKAQLNYSYNIIHVCLRFFSIVGFFSLFHYQHTFEYAFNLKQHHSATWPLPWIRRCAQCQIRNRKKAERSPRLKKGRKETGIWNTIYYLQIAFFPSRLLFLVPSYFPHTTKLRCLKRV